MIKRFLKFIIVWAMKEKNRISYGEDVKSCSNVPIGLTNDIEGSKNPLTIVVHHAEGGRVIQCHHYDDHANRRKSNLYVITQDDDLVEELSMILTKESLAK